MINKVMLKGVITYKNKFPPKKDEIIMEFGLSYNSLTKIRYMNSIVCYANGKVAKIIDEDLIVKDTIMVVGFLTTRTISMQEKIVLNVEQLEPLKTTKNVLFRDASVDAELFDKFINGFDINK